MRALILLLFLVFAAPSLAQAPATDVGAADRTAIRNVISDQLAAFQRDDGAAAFGLAAPSIQQIFRDPDTFMAMVRGGYQPVYRPRDVAFRDLLRFEGQLVQTVALVGPDGRRVLALYPMEQQGDGTWRIAGCQLLEPGDEST